MANTTANDWDESSPALADPRKNGATEISSLRKSVRSRLAKEHVTPAGSGVGGEHLAGSAISYCQASAPTTRPDGVTSLDSDDKGRIWVDTDNFVVKVWDGSAWQNLAANATVPAIYQFEKLDGGSSPTIPLTQSGLTDGTWMVWVEGTTINGSGSTSFTVSLTVNSITRTIVVDNVPDGTAPFSCCIQVTVSGGTISLTAASNVQRITKMLGFRTT